MTPANPQKNIEDKLPDLASIRIKPCMAQGEESKRVSNNCDLVRRRPALDKFLDQELRKTRRVVPHNAVLLEQIVEQAAHAHALQVLDINAHRLGATPV